MQINTNLSHIIENSHNSPTSANFSISPTSNAPNEKTTLVAENALTPSEMGKEEIKNLKIKVIHQLDYLHQTKLASKFLSALDKIEDRWDRINALTNTCNTLNHNTNPARESLKKGKKQTRDELIGSLDKTRNTAHFQNAINKNESDQILYKEAENLADELKELNVPLGDSALKLLYKKYIDNGQYRAAKGVTKKMTTPENLIIHVDNEIQKEMIHSFLGLMVIVGSIFALCYGDFFKLRDET